jgi:hypothetical protein
MSSILTNNSAMVALQTMKQINKGMGKVQGEISTGMKVATAKDNSSSVGNCIDDALGCQLVQEAFGRTDVGLCDGRCCPSCF